MQKKQLLYWAIVVKNIDYLAFAISDSITGEFAVGFMSHKWYDTLQLDSENLIQADATFYVVSKQFYQLMRIHLQFKSYPLQHCISSCLASPAQYKKEQSTKLKKSHN